MSDKIEIADEFNDEAQEVAKFTRELMYLTEARINMLFLKAKEKSWYTGPESIIEGMLFDFCKNSSSCESWSNYCETNRLRPR